MIILDLRCANNHRFEAWFASREAFETQSGAGQVCCVWCQSNEITALPSGPRVIKGRSSQVVVDSRPDPEQVIAERIYHALATIARQAENVGTRFPEEARRIYYQEVTTRSIRGQATHDETRELLEEGILVLPAPIPPENETH
jgi:hypothetical protein